MAQGEVVKISDDRFWGFIKPQGGGKNVFFLLREIQDARSEMIQVGMRVEFDAYETTKGLRARWVRLAGSVSQAGAGRQTTSTTGARQDQQDARLYRFLNPYNFVRTPRAPQSYDGDANTILLGRCSPPPHDRFVGLTGKIACELEAVTPLFISGPDYFYASQEDQAVDHRTYQFFKYDFGEDPEHPKPEHALPASSLRGMVRSAFEAVTNSCFAHFTYGKRLSRHLPAADALKLVPARVEKDDQGRWRLLLLPGTASLTIGDRPRDTLYAARVERYRALRPVIKRIDGKPPVYRPVDLGSLKHKDHCFALAESLKFPPVWNVLRVSSSRSELVNLVKPGQQILDGYLCVNNQNIENKRFERFFFQTGKKIYAPLSDDVLKKYAELIEDYQKRHEETIRKWMRHDPPYPPDLPKDRRNAAFSRFVIGGPGEAQEGDLVYVMLSGSAQAPEVEYIIPVAIPRIGNKRKMDQLLARHLWKCEDAHRLCPACRTFGWVYGNERQPEDLIPLDKPVAYAGRVQFTLGKLISETPPATLPRTQLSILSTPKPTTTRFYLKPVSQKPQPGQDDYQAGYDNPKNVLRGRKIYRHHGHAGDRSYWSDGQREYQAAGKPSDQNRSVEDALLPGARFEFSVHFENMAPVELGVLLWALELGNAGCHRLGFAKPLGFGSVRVRVKAIRLVQPWQRYTEAAAEGIEDGLAYKSEWVRLFEQSMERAYEKPFLQLEHICDLLALVSDPDPVLPVHYPRTNIQPDPEGKNFEWFMGNNRNRDARYVLELPGEEKGLPLLDKYGKEK